MTAHLTFRTNDGARCFTDCPACSACACVPMCPHGDECSCLVPCERPTVAREPVYIRSDFDNVYVELTRDQAKRLAEFARQLEVESA